MIAPSQVTSEPATGAPRGRSSAISLLLVEDNPGDADLARERLAEVPGYRFELRHVARLADAVAAVEEGGIDAVLLDLDLPDSRGLASLRRLRQLSDGVAIVVLSGHGSDELQRAVLGEGAQDFVGKDESPRLLVRSLLFALERHRTDLRQRRMEDRLREAQKLEAIGRLAGGVAHDFNNLLCVILGYGEMLERTHRGEAADAKALDRIMTAAGRARDLTRQLLAFGRRQIIRPQVIDLGVVLDSTLELLRRIIPEDIEIVVDRGETACRVEVDPVQLEQVIMNLALNARDAMPKGGRLSFEISAFDAGDVSTFGPEVAAGPHSVLAVSDTGSGMSRETLANIFEPFFTTKDVGEGTGLGLATVWGIVKQSGGHVRVESEPGRGTRFEVLFPCAHASAGADDSEEAVPVSASGGETILLVEDDAMIRELSREVLEADGYRVLLADGGVEALTTAQGHAGPIHLLLTDLVMPGVSGSELAERLLALRPKVRVLFMSGYSAELSRGRAQLPAGAALVEKPFVGGTLLRSIREVLDSHPANSDG